MDFTKLSKKDITKLYNDACNYYYNSDSPIMTDDEFDNLYKGQVSKTGVAVLPSKRTRRIPEIKNPINVFVDDLVSIDISNWFDDLDIAIDKNEKITFDILEDDGSGSLKSITDLEISNWIEFNSDKNFTV